MRSYDELVEDWMGKHGAASVVGMEEMLDIDSQVGGRGFPFHMGPSTKGRSGRSSICSMQHRTRNMHQTLEW